MSPSRVDCTGEEGLVCMASEQQQEREGGREGRGRCGCGFRQLRVSEPQMGVSSSRSRAAGQELLPRSGST